MRTFWLPLALIGSCLVTVTSISVSTSIAASASRIPLNQYPILLSHDAATGDLDKERDHVVDDWAQTQSTGLVGQLNCGARGFDYRPYLKDGTLYAHHGPVVIHKKVHINY
jgi:hypothetical protein